MQEDLYPMAGWFKANKTVLNPQKSNYMIFSAGKVDNNVLEFKISGDTIIKVGKTKCLCIPQMDRSCQAM